MAPRASNEHDKFQRYIVRNLRYLTQLVADSAPLPSDEVRSQALHSLNYGLSIPDSWQTTCALMLALAPKMEQAGHRYDWLPYLERAIRLSEQLHDLQSAAELTMQRGILYRLLSEFELAKHCLRHSIDLCQTIHSPHNQARALNELAWVEYLQTQTKPAAEHVQQALDLLAADDPERAMSYRVQGMLAIFQSQWKEAESLHSQALVIFEEQRERRKTAWSLQNVGVALLGQERYSEAIVYFEQAAELMLMLDDLYHWSVVQMNLGITYRHLDQPEKALTHYNAARSIPKSLLEPFHLARLSVNTAISLMLLSRFSEAEQAFLEAIALQSQTGSTAWRLNAMDGLAMTYIGWQKFEQAVTILEQALAELPNISETPNFNYLSHSLHGHLEEAHRGLQTSC